MNSTACLAAGQAGPSKVRAARPTGGGPATIKGPWSHWLRDDFVTETAGLSDQEFRVALLLESHASPERPYCWPKLVTLGALTGKPKAGSTLRVILDGLETKGWVERVYGSRRELLGFVLLRRVMQGVAADDPARLAGAHRALREHAQERRIRRSCAVRSAGFGAPGAQDSALSGAQDSALPIEDEPSQSEPSQGNDRSIERRSGSGGTEDAPPAEPSPRAAAAIVEAAALDLHRRVYEGLPESVARADWEQWGPRYRGVARDVAAGRLTGDQVAEAVRIARKPDTNRRGQRFLGAVRDFLAGRTPKGAAGPPAPPPAPAPRPEPGPEPGPEPEPLSPMTPEQLAKIGAAIQRSRERFLLIEAEAAERKAAAEQADQAERQRRDEADRQAAEQKALVATYDAELKAHRERLRAEWDAMAEDARAEIRRPIRDRHPWAAKLPDQAMMIRLLDGVAERLGLEGPVPPRRAAPLATP